MIRDHKTGDSLQYAFVEFEDQKACENAYFKMDNVLIDDRRIHVDFSQSVSKFRWKGKGRLEVVGGGGDSDKNRRKDSDRGNRDNKVVTRVHNSIWWDWVERTILDILMLHCLVLFIGLFCPSYLPKQNQAER